MTTDPILAAAVSYRPAQNLTEAFSAIEVPPGASLTFYDLVSLDGREGLAGLYLPERKAEDAPLVLSVHGSGGSIAKEPVKALAAGLVAHGYPVLAINTRQSNDAVNTDNFYATVRDIEAAYWMARSLGYTRIVLHGHSLGSLQVSFFTATHWDSSTVGVVLTGMPADLPWKSRYLLIGDEAVYGALRDEAVAAVQAFDYGRILSNRMSWLKNAEARVSAEHFLTYRTEGIAGPRSVEWVKRIPYPALMLRDQHDPIVHAFEADWMGAAARDGISPSVSCHTLPSEPSPDGHNFALSRVQLIDTVSRWLSELPR